MQNWVLWNNSTGLAGGMKRCLQLLRILVRKRTSNCHWNSNLHNMMLESLTLRRQGLSIFTNMKILIHIYKLHTISVQTFFVWTLLQYFDLRPGPKMLFQCDAPEGSDTLIERDRVGGLRLIIWDKVKVPLCHYWVIHRKGVTSEQHDSYFRLMTIKHSISKIEWASNDYITK